MRKLAAATATAAFVTFHGYLPKYKGLSFSLYFFVCLRQYLERAPRRQHPNNFRFFANVTSKVFGLLNLILIYKITSYFKMKNKLLQ